MAGAVGAGNSLFIELYQLAWSGVRKASANDLLMNALGAFVGFTTLRLTGYRRWLAAPRLKLQIYPTASSWSWSS